MFRASRTAQFPAMQINWKFPTQTCIFQKLFTIRLSYWPASGRAPDPWGTADFPNNHLQSFEVGTITCFNLLEQFNGMGHPMSPMGVRWRTKMPQRTNASEWTVDQRCVADCTRFSLHASARDARAYIHQHAVGASVNLWTASVAYILFRPHRYTHDSRAALRTLSRYCIYFILTVQCASEAPPAGPAGLAAGAGEAPCIANCITLVQNTRFY